MAHAYELWSLCTTNFDVFTLRLLQLHFQLYHVMYFFTNNGL